MPHPSERPPPAVADIVRALARHRVDWVLTGSAVLVACGARLRPNDLDVVASPEQGNLRRLAALLTAIHAVPAYFPDWADGPTLRWCLDWRPEPATTAQFDHLLVTDLGMLDLPPKLTGGYAELRPGATRHEVAGQQVWICDPAEVLGRLDGRARSKDIARARIYAGLRARAPITPTRDGLAWLGSIS